MGEGESDTAHGSELAEKHEGVHGAGAGRDRTLTQRRTRFRAGPGSRSAPVGVALKRPPGHRAGLRAAHDHADRREGDRDLEFRSVKIQILSDLHLEHGEQVPAEHHPDARVTRER